MLKAMKTMWSGLSSKEWDRIDSVIYGANVKYKRYSHISVNVNLGQEILDERNILCVLTSELYNKYRLYVLSPIANVEVWIINVGILVLSYSVFHDKPKTTAIYGALAMLCVSYHQLKTLFSLSTLRKRIDAELKTSQAVYSGKDQRTGRIFKGL